MGTENAGVSLFVKDNRLVFDYNIFMDHHLVVSDVEVPVGVSVVGVEFRRGRNDAQATLTIDGAVAGTKALPFLMRVFSTIAMSIGRDHGSAVSKEYEGDFPFEGRVERVDIQLVSKANAEEKETAAREGMARQ
jgi:arylsulfatase